MDETTLQQRKTVLQELQLELKTEVEHSRAESAPVAVDGRMGRISRGDAMQAQQVALEVRRRREQRLLRIQTALKRIDEGTYGQCGRCRNPVSSARLEAFPDSVLCMRCASAPGRQ